MALTDTEQKALDHLGYEWWMFQAVYRELLSHTDDGPLRNALVESLAIHGRNLIDFFYTKPGSDDLSPTNVRSRRETTPIPAFLAEWKTEANKRVAHLTETRFSGYKLWNAEKVLRSLDALISGVRYAMDSDLPPDWIGDKLKGTATLAMIVEGLHSTVSPTLIVR